ncbi:hypothetical protein IFR05_005461 [Cadophora sp. M221]|nr:hypothetical protein IFR05_005461 [Cadophora sp. M221]
MAGRGRGRGGFNPGQLKGATWEYDATAVLETKPSELFPPHPNLKKPASLTDKELREINNYRSLQAKIHRGPLFTQSTKRNANAPTKTFSEAQVNAQYGGNAKADMDPFTGVETYSMRYAPKKNTLPKLSDAPFDKSLFPEELWDTLDGKAGAEVKKHINRSMAKKAQMLSGVGDSKDKTKLMLEKINDAVDGVDDEDDDEEDEAAADSEFEDDDGGDYDAEQYFDGGEDRDDDDGEDGGQEY